MELFLITAAATMGDKIDNAFRSFDMLIYHFFGAMQNDFLTVLAKIFTAIGDENFVIPVAVLGVVLCFFKKTRKYGFALIFAIAIGTIVTNVVVKPLFLRIRPYNTLQMYPELWADYSVWYKAAGALSESDYSFPSGHTTAAFEMAISMFLCFRSAAKEKKANGEESAMGKIAFVFPVIALCTMGSRVYLMVHYATDVIAGLIVGTCAGTAGYFLSKLVCKIFEKTPLDKIDAGKIFKKEISPKITASALCVVLVAFFCISFIPSLSEGGAEEKRCEYYGEYDCQNAARVDDKDYPPLDPDGDGQDNYYCKIHWKQLQEGTNLVKE